MKIRINIFLLIENALKVVSAIYAKGVEIVSSHINKDRRNFKDFSLWFELIKDYNLEVQYHPCKANVVADLLILIHQFSHLSVKQMGITIYHKMVLMNLEIIQHGSLSKIVIFST